MEDPVDGMDPPDARWLKALTDENAWLKKPPAEQMPDTAIPEDVSAPKW